MQSDRQADVSGIVIGICLFGECHPATAMALHCFHQQAYMVKQELCFNYRHHMEPASQPRSGQTVELSSVKVKLQREVCWKETDPGSLLCPLCTKPSLIVESKGIITAMKTSEKRTGSNIFVIDHFLTLCHQLWLSPKWLIYYIYVIKV